MDNYYLPISDIIQLDAERSVYRVTHRCFTLDGLYSFGDRQSWWWQIVDVIRTRWPAWFLPPTCVIKVYEPSLEKGGTSPAQRIQYECEVYTKLKALQGWMLPRYYGSTTSQGHPALLLQYAQGVGLNKIKIERLSENEVAHIASDLKCFVSMLTRHHIKGDIKDDNFIWDGISLKGLDFDVQPFDSETWVRAENNGGLIEILKGLEISGTSSH